MSKTKQARKDKQVPGPTHEFLSRDERLAAGKLLRAKIPLAQHALWKESGKRRDPINVLKESNQHRIPELVPIRYGRMLRSPFTFLRGSAGLMAYDLSTTPNTGIRVQACGDCHLLNFGLFATPERNLIFDINDFDETLPAPWEWDIKRLTASFAVAANGNNCSNKEAQKAAVECARAYRQHLRECSKMSPLEVWYERRDLQEMAAATPNAKLRHLREAMIEKARERIGEYLVPKLTTVRGGGQRRLIDQPPVLFHVSEEHSEERFRKGMELYRLSLPDSVRVLFDRYRLEDWAVKVVGIGSVGTRCLVGLFFSPEGHPLLMQFKEACPSVLAPYAGESIYENQGQRVVVGQRLMQSSSDILLGWTRGELGFHFFGRQLRDMKMAIPVEGASARDLKRYAGQCGIVLARAHAKSGDAAKISGYLGKSDTFDQAIGEFSLAYMDQTIRDHARLVAAVKHGRITALVEEDL